MKRFFLLTLFALTLMACGEGRVNLITKDAISDAAGCYESVEVVDDAYLVSLEKNCVDLALSDFVIESPPVEQGTLPAVREWELIATLERDVRQKFWHEFYVQDDVKSDILTAYTTGKDFLFVIEKVGGNSFVPIQYSFMQPEPPTGLNVLFFQASGWFEYWAPDFNWIVRKPEREGLIVSLDPGSAGTNFLHPENRKKKWVLGDVEFRVTRSKALLFADSYEPHIRAGYVLKIYVR